MSKTDIVKSLKFRSYIFRVITVILAILNSYHIIDNDKINLFYMAAFIVTAMASSDLSEASDHISEIQSKESHDGDSQR